MFSPKAAQDLERHFFPPDLQMTQDAPFSPWTIGPHQGYTNLQGVQGPQLQSLLVTRGSWLVEEEKNVDNHTILSPLLSQPHLLGHLKKPDDFTLLTSRTFKPRRWSVGTPPDEDGLKLLPASQPSPLSTTSQGNKFDDGATP